MLGHYENFPLNIHHVETYTSSLAKRKLQERLIQTLQKINKEQLSFEQIGVPTIPDCTVIFEFGIADEGNFVFLGDETAQELQKAVTEETLQVMDWFCGIRYYRQAHPRKKPLKFDYYLLRVGFAEKCAVEFLVYHERGPRYISPQDLMAFIKQQVNEAAKRKILKQTRHN